MKIQSDTARTKRRALGKRVRTKIGPRAVIFLIAAAAITGTIAISLNLKLQAWEKAHSLGQGRHLEK